VTDGRAAQGRVRDDGVRAWQTGTPDPTMPGSAGEVMSTPVITASVDTSVEDALREMRHQDVHHLLLTDRGRIVAVVSDRDLARQRPAPTRDEERRVRHPVFQVAQYQLRSVAQSTPLQDAARIMLRESVSSLPVVNQAGEIAGILTSRDLLRYLAFSHLRHRWREAP